VSRHKNGFRSPLGKLKGINLAIENMGPRDLQAYNFYDGKTIAFEFESGITVEGLNITGMRNLRGELMLIQFIDCTVTHKSEILFSPQMGDFDMAVGKEIVSAFAGAADYLSFDLARHRSETETIRVELSEKEKELNSLYKKVRMLRENEHESIVNKLAEIFGKVITDHPKDWLLPLEIYEKVSSENSQFSEKVLSYLSELRIRRPNVAHLIDDGLRLIGE